MIEFATVQEYAGRFETLVMRLDIPSYENELESNFGLAAACFLIAKHLISTNELPGYEDNVRQFILNVKSAYLSDEPELESPRIPSN